MSVDREARIAAAQRVVPREGWLVVVPLVPEEVTDSGLHLITSDEAVPAKVEVVCISSEELEFLVGDLLLMQKYQGLLYEIDKQEVMLLPIDAVVGWVK